MYNVDLDHSKYHTKPHNMQDLQQEKQANREAVNGNCPEDLSSFYYRAAQDPKRYKRWNME